MKTIIEGQLYTDPTVTLFHRTPQVGRDLKRSSHRTWSIPRVANRKRLFNKVKEETPNDEDTFKILSKPPLEQTTQ